MKYLALIALVFSVQAHASFGSQPMRRATEELAPQPKVDCEIDYSKNHPDGTNDEYVPGESFRVEQNRQANYHGFAIEVNVSRVCAMDGGPCTNSFELSLDVKNGESASFSEVQIAAGDHWKRYLTSLKVGQETASLMCDVNDELLHTK